jgi:integrase
MASIRPRARADGAVAYQVLFRIDGHQVGETFDTLPAADQFVGWIDRYGGQQARDLRARRTGNIRGTPTVAAWAREHVTRLSGITDGTRARYHRIVDTQLEPTTLGQLPVDVAERRHVQAWIQAQETAGASGKTILNRHGLLFAAFRSATAERLRTGVNPCEHSRIAKTERRAVTFLTHGEFAILLTHMATWWQPLTVTLAGTGLRFGEATALQVGDAALDDPVPSLRIERAWKFVNGSTRQLGPPKTQKGRRTVSLSPNVVGMLRPLIADRGAGEFLFTTRTGQPVRNVDYREDGWLPALARATATEDEHGRRIPASQRLTKRPRIHDLRHSHASWLIAAGLPLPEIQHRLGHESIKTSSDLYGHLMPGSQQRAADAMTVALAQALPELEPSPGQQLPDAPAQVVCE